MRNFAHCAPACRGVPSHSHPHPTPLPLSRGPSLPLYFSDWERSANTEPKKEGCKLRTFHSRVPPHPYRGTASGSPRKRSLRFPLPLGLQLLYCGLKKVKHTPIDANVFLKARPLQTLAPKEPGGGWRGKHVISGDSSTPRKARARPGGRLAGFSAAGRSGWIM